MAGPEHYGFPLGKRRSGDWIFNYQNKRNWVTYNLPPPEGVHPKTSYTTCSICLSQFLVAPDLKFIAAFNRAGSAWGEPNPAPGTLTVSYLENGDLIHLSASPEDQKQLRLEFAEQEFELHGRAVMWQWPVGAVPWVQATGPRGWTAVTRESDPLTCPCGSTDKRLVYILCLLYILTHYRYKQHQETGKHKRWLAAQPDDEEPAVEVAVTGNWW